MPKVEQRKYPELGTTSCKQFFMKLEELHNLIDYFHFDFYETIYGNLDRDPQTGEYDEHDKETLNKFSSYFEILDQLVYCKVVDGFENYIIQSAIDVFKENRQDFNLKLSFEVSLNELNSKNLKDLLSRQVDSKILDIYKRKSISKINEKIFQDLGIRFSDDSELKAIERIFQIRHLYTHANGIIHKEHKELSKIMKDKKLSIGDKVVLSAKEIQEDLSFIIGIVTKFDKEVVKKFKLKEHKIEKSKSFNPVYL